MLSNPLCRGIGSVERLWKFMFRGARIVHGHDQALGPIRQAAAEAIMRIQIAEHKAATMKVDQDRERAASFRGIDSDRNGSSRAINHAIFDVSNGFRFAK